MSWSSSLIYSSSFSRTNCVSGTLLDSGFCSVGPHLWPLLFNAEEREGSKEIRQFQLVISVVEETVTRKYRAEGKIREGLLEEVSLS